MTQDSLAQRLWLAAHTDAGLLNRLRVTYRGRFDVLDALWWRFRPLTPTESGHADPALELAALQAHVYSRDGLDEPVIDRPDPVTGRPVAATATEHRLRALTAQLQLDAAAVDALLERMHDQAIPSATTTTTAATPAGPAPAQVESPTAPATRFAISPADAPAGSPTSTVLSPRADVALAHRGHPVIFALGLLLGVVLGGFATFGLLGLVEPSGRGDSASAQENPAAADEGASRTEAADVLQIFDEVADWGAEEAPHLGREYRPETIRSVLGPAPTGTGFGVYVAQRGTAEYCIIVQDADQSGSTACATHRTIAASGLHLHALVWSPPGPRKDPSCFRST